ncbi:MAG: efflux RND transporter periplasmic adaptor subunit [Proteobacteria bacterium]|nr:efflux RND transporter periplasmic adaptor subunit [Pseudomonadota bacterium]MBU1709223.1 efflux RND transporter periplasmic adaptor subunit [Pseudomonadota bacterium]
MNTYPINHLSKKIWSLLPWLTLLVLILLILIFMASIGKKKQAIEDEQKKSMAAVIIPVNIVAQRLTQSVMSDSLDLPAITKPWEDLTVIAEVGGTIISMEVVEGDTVVKGQLLASIDNRDYENSLKSLEARQKLAATTYSRLEKLSGKSAVSQSQFDEAQATLAELNAAVATAKLNLERCFIRAPIAGVVNALPAKTGMFLSQNDPVAQILDINRLKVDVAIPESAVSSVRQIKESIIRFAALDGLEVTGTNIFLSSQPDSYAMVYTFRLAIDNYDHTILPGMFARVRIDKSVVNDALGIPLYAVISKEGEQFIYVIEDGVARKRPITTGFLEGWKVQIVKGLKSGELVAIVGHRSLEDGQAVNIVKTVDNPDPGTI